MIKFRELRSRISATDRLSICNKDTLQYKNFITINDVPALYDDLNVYGIGIIESEFYRTNDFEYSAEGSQEDLVLLSCIEVVVIPQGKLQDITASNKMGIGSIVQIVEEDSVGIVKSVHNDFNIEVDIYYQKDAYLVPLREKIVTYKDVSLVDDSDFRVGFLRYLSRRDYLHIYSERDKERMSAVLHQVKKAWETYPDLRLGQLLMGCCANDSVMFGIEDEMLMEKLHKVFLDKDKSIS